MGFLIAVVILAFLSLMIGIMTEKTFYYIVAGIFLTAGVIFISTLVITLM